jgi:hypothetical protein
MHYKDIFKLCKVFDRYDLDTSRLDVFFARFDVHHIDLALIPRGRSKYVKSGYGRFYLSL